MRWRCKQNLRDFKTEENEFFVCVNIKIIIKREREREREKNLFKYGKSCKGARHPWDCLSSTIIIKSEARHTRMKFQLLRLFSLILWRDDLLPFVFLFLQCERQQKIRSYQDAPPPREIRKCRVRSAVIFMTVCSRSEKEVKKIGGF